MWTFRRAIRIMVNVHSATVSATVMAVWVYTKLPETLHEDDRVPIRLPVIVRNMRHSLTLRATIGYTLGSALVFGAFRQSSSKPERSRAAARPLRRGPVQAPHACQRESGSGGWT